MDLNKLKRHLIKTIDYANAKISIDICNDMDNNKIVFELIDSDTNDCIESFSNPILLNQILDYLLVNGLFDGFNVVNY